MAQRDTVLRWIEQLGRLIARLLGTSAPGDLKLARREIEAAVDQLLGPIAQLVPRLQAASAADLLHDPERIFGLAQLLDLQATLEEAEGEPARAAASRERAMAFAEEACRRAAPPRDDWWRWLAERKESREEP